MGQITELIGMFFFVLILGIGIIIISLKPTIAMNNGNMMLQWKVMQYLHLEGWSFAPEEFSRVCAFCDANADNTELQRIMYDIVHDKKIKLVPSNRNEKNQDKIYIDILSENPGKERKIIDFLSCLPA